MLANRYKQADQWRKTSIVLSKFEVLALAISLRNPPEIDLRNLRNPSTFFYGIGIPRQNVQAKSKFRKVRSSRMFPLRKIAGFARLRKM
jgi:hypothetical protein